MSPRSPPRDSNSPPIPPPSNTPPALHYFSRPERTPHSGGPHTKTRANSPSSVEPPTRSFLQSVAYESNTNENMLQASPTESISSHRARSPFRSGRRQDSPSSSSQGDIADTDVDSGPASQPDQSSGHQTSDQPVKKKRTRTLTTPHQAAVLHALLAQSRFPTTAMREEVGRQIGLSARKVQIWFQNQRQKARRPHGHNAAPQRLDRPPQFGAFPSVPMSAPLSENAHGSLLALAETYFPWPHPHSAGSGSQLESTSRPSTSGSVRGGLVIPDPQHSRQMLSPTDRRSSYPRYLINEASSHDEGRIPREHHEASNWSPPSVDPHTSSGLSASQLSRDSMSTRFDHPTTRLPSLSVDLSTNANLPGIHPATTPTLPAIPPPFTLEPRPQWQPDPSLPVGLAWRGNNLFRSHGSDSSTHQQSSPQSLRNGGIENERGPQAPTSPSLRGDSRRFDPIRSSVGEATPANLSRPPEGQHHPGSSQRGVRRYSED